MPDALTLLATGLSIAEVARTTGQTEDEVAEVADEVAVEMESLRMARRAVMPQALKGDPSSLRLAVRIAEVRAALIAKTPPPPEDQEGGDLVDDLRQRRLERLGRRRPAPGAAEDRTDPGLPQQRR